MLTKSKLSQVWGISDHGVPIKLRNAPPWKQDVRVGWIMVKTLRSSVPNAAEWLKRWGREAHKRGSVYNVNDMTSDTRLLLQHVKQNPISSQILALIVFLFTWKIAFRFLRELMEDYYCSLAFIFRVIVSFHCFPFPILLPCHCSFMQGRKILS